MRFIITIRGEVGPLTRARLDALGCQTHGDGSLLSGDARDQAELLSLLQDLHGLGLTLTDVHWQATATERGDRRVRPKWFQPDTRRPHRR